MKSFISPIVFIILLCSVSKFPHAFRGLRRSQNLKWSATRSGIDLSIEKEPQSFKVHKLSKSLTRNVQFLSVMGALLIAPKLSRARAGLTDDEKDLQQNQRPDQSEAAVFVNGIKPDYAAVRKDISEMINAKPEKGPTFVRLAWHSSGTYDKMTKTGGSSKGTIRFSEELAHGGNAGLDIAISWLEPIYKKYNKNADLSYADLYTLAGVEAIKTMKGPDIKWRAGRLDSYDPVDVTPDGRLPDADKGAPQKTADGLRGTFYRMGFDDREIVALSGAHALGRCHATASGYIGPWTPTPTTFNNLYFKLLSSVNWTVNPKAPKLQYQDPSGKLMMLPSDLVLIQDAKFKPYVDQYAKSEKEFFADFSAAFSKLLELGTAGLYDA